MAYTEVLTSGNSAVTSAEQWDSLCYEEYIGKLMMKWLIGTDENAVLVAQEDLTKDHGDAITFNYVTTQSGGTVRGNAKGVGNEGKITPYAQRLVVDNTRTLHKVWDLPMTQQRTTYDIIVKAKNALTTKHAETLDDDIIEALTDTGVGRVRGRFLYGALDSNWNAVHATALQNIDNAADQLTGNMISVAKRKATIKGTGVTEKIRPTMVKNGMKYEKWFIFLAHEYAIRDLVNNDAAFRNAQLLLPPGRNSDSMFFTGSDFKGSWDGVLIYVNDRLPLTSSTIQTAHNLLMGAQAGAVSFAQRSKFGEEFEDLKHNAIYELHDIRFKNGTGSDNNVKLVRNSVDHGIINVFSAAAAD